MERQKFINNFHTASDSLDMEYINKVIAGALDRFQDKFPQYERGHMNVITTMEETAELIEAISRRLRGRTDDNFDILQEMGDVIIAIWIVARIFGISHTDIKKAINVKIGQEVIRIRQHEQGLETQ